MTIAGVGHYLDQHPLWVPTKIKAKRKCAASANQQDAEKNGIYRENQEEMVKKKRKRGSSGNGTGSTAAAIRFDQGTDCGTGATCIIRGVTATSPKLKIPGMTRFRKSCRVPLPRPWMRAAWPAVALHADTWPGNPFHGDDWHGMALPDLWNAALNSQTFQLQLPNNRGPALIAAKLGSAHATIKVKLKALVRDAGRRGNDAVTALLIKFDVQEPKNPSNDKTTSPTKALYDQVPSVSKTSRPLKSDPYLFKSLQVPSTRLTWAKIIKIQSFLKIFK
ncbi:hypothetical protein B0H19DRAFT_1243901 [Mycena capillaripes]|nr:hypothetical protein B0H19DRAFT_1243901 [Mycena capillaripes]